MSEVRARADDMRHAGESFCADCPDHEACATGWPCWKVREVNDAWGASTTSAPPTTVVTCAVCLRPIVQGSLHVH